MHTPAVQAKAHVIPNTPFGLTTSTTTRCCAIPPPQLRNVGMVLPMTSGVPEWTSRWLDPDPN